MPYRLTAGFILAASALFIASSSLAQAVPQFTDPFYQPSGLGMTINPNTCTHYVATNGNNNNSGTSPNQAFKTITHGGKQLSAGDTLCIKSGTYRENPNFRGLIGTANRPITMGGYESSKQVTINGGRSGVPSKETNTFSIFDSKHVRVIGLEIENSSGKGVVIENSEDMFIKNINSHNNWRIGINAVRNKRIGIENVQVWDNIRRRAETNTIGGGGMQVLLTDQAYVRDSMVYRNFGEGLNVGRASNEVLVQHNRFWENAHTMLYNNHAANTLFDGNFFVCSGDRMAWMQANNVNSGNPSNGTAMTFRNESADNQPGIEEGENNGATNNIFLGCTRHIVFGTQADKVMKDTLVAHNTFIEAVPSEGRNPKTHYIVSFGGSSYTEPVVFANNLIIQRDDEAGIINGGSVKSLINQDLLRFRNNITTIAPKNIGSGFQTIPNFQLNKEFDPRDVKNPANVDPADYTLPNNSPAINAAGNISEFDFNELSKDFFNRARPFGNKSDIGAQEFNGQIIPTITPTRGSQWDLNKSGITDILDFSYFILDYVTNYSFPNISSFASEI